jgi:membrane protein YdbS with pleckstrin-like domain
MYCHKCGNRLTTESLFCNRCGSKVQGRDASAQPHAAHLAVPPPRPARRAPVSHDPSDLGPPDEYNEYDEYDEDPSYAPAGRASNRYAADRNAEAYYENSGGEEQVIFRVSPAFYEVSFTYLWAAALSLIVTAAIALAHGGLWIAGVFTLVFFIAPIIRHIRLRSTVFTLTNVKVEIRSGIFSISTRNIPLRHIQDVTVSETLKERLIGIGDVLIDSAAVGGKIAVNNIKNPRKYADMILDQLQYWN